MSMQSYESEAPLSVYIPVFPHTVGKFMNFALSIFSGKNNN